MKTVAIALSLAVALVGTATAQAAGLSISGHPRNLERCTAAVGRTVTRVS